MKQAVVFQNLVNNTNEECQPVLDEATAKMKTEVLRSNVLALELHVFHISHHHLSIKSSIHNISVCVTI